MQRLTQHYRYQKPDNFTINNWPNCHPSKKYRNEKPRHISTQEAQMLLRKMHYSLYSSCWKFLLQ